MEHKLLLGVQQLFCSRANDARLPQHIVALDVFACLISAPIGSVLLAMRSLIVLFVTICMSAGCATSENEEDAARKRCTRMRDHLVDLRLASAGDRVDVRAHRAALTQALGDAFVAKCKELPVATVKCLLGATDSVSANECSPPESTP